MSVSSPVLTLHDCQDPDRAVYSMETPHGERFDTVRIRPAPVPADVEWLWPDRIPLGTVTVIEGAAGSGKSRVAFDLAARAAARHTWPDGTPAALPAADVLVIARHQEAGRITAQIQRSEAEPRHVFQFDGFDSKIPAADRFGRRPVSLPDDLEALEFYLECHGSIGVVIIDPLTDFCRTPRHLAETLYQLNDLAARGRLAILVTVAVDCRTDAQGRLRESARSLTSAARCVWSIVRDPDDPGRRLLVARRTNFCGEPDGLAFRIDANGVAWESESAVSALDPLGALGAADRCIHELLSSGPESASSVVRLGAEQGFSAKQLRSAARRLGVIHRRMGFSKGGHWEWSLPNGRLANGEPHPGQPTISGRPVESAAIEAADSINVADQSPVVSGSPTLAGESTPVKFIEIPMIEPLTPGSPQSGAAPNASGASTPIGSADGGAGTVSLTSQATGPVPPASPGHFTRRRGRGKYRKRHRHDAAALRATAGGPAESG
jgi:hypothetical protein